MKKKQESDKRVKNYERILQTVPIILRCTLGFVIYVHIGRINTRFHLKTSFYE